MGEQPPEESPAKRRYAMYIAEREKLIEYEFEASRDCDKWTFGAAGAALTLSFAFAKDFVRLDAAVLPTLLFLAWFFFVVSVATTLAALHLGRAAQRKYRLCWDAAACEGYGEEFLPRVRDAHQRCWQAGWTSIVGTVGLATLIAGLVCLFFFVSLNVFATGVSNGIQRSAPSVVGTGSVP